MNILKTKSNPLQIVMTPVRNEAWVLRLYLTLTSIWADYIVIADQMSTDGSREIAAEFPKVVMIDNMNPDFNEAERQALLVAKAREIADGRDCILWGLDADEIFDAHFKETEDWQKVLASKPGDVFWFKWAEICPDKKHYWISPKTYYPWMFHDDGREPHGNYVRNMHSMRIPYPIEEKQLYYVDDFRVLHLAYLNPYRVAAKRRFYTFVDWEMNYGDPISLSRKYYQTKKSEIVEELPLQFIYNLDGGNDMWSMVDCQLEKCWMDDYVLARLGHHPITETRKLDIWRDSTELYKKIDKRRFVDRILHSYLHSTQNVKTSFVIRAIDKVLKFAYR